MHVKKLLSLIIVLSALGSLSAQDIHFTQFYMSPQTTNPATTGKFLGTARIGGIYRSQWASVIKDEFHTPSVFVDAPIIRGFRKKDWVGVGLMLYSDKAGAGGLTHTAGKLAAAYHLALNKKGDTYLSVGAHYGGEQRNINKDKLTFQDGYLDYGGNQKLSADYGRIGGDAKYTDIDGGVILTSKLNKTMDFSVGFSMFHIGEPDYSLLGGGGTGGGTGGNTGGGNSKIPRRSLVHGQFNIDLNEKWEVSPMFLFQTMNGADEIMVQGLTGYLLNPEKDITLNLGLGYRLGDALQILLGAKYKDLRVGFSYDVNTSDLSSVSNYRGGFELAANYIFKVYKKAKVKQKVLCPRF